MKDIELILQEIERLKAELPPQDLHTTVGADSIRIANKYDEILSFIGSLQQEQPEVDLEQEVSKWWDASFPEPDFKFRKHQAHCVSNNEIIKLARYFYQLGLNARKEE